MVNKSKFLMVKKHILKIIFPVLLYFIFSSCNESITKPEMLGYLDIAVFTNDSVQVEYDGDVIFIGNINCTDVFCFVKTINPATVGVHNIGFTVFNDTLKYENSFFLEDTTTVEILYYKPINSSTKIYEFRTFNRKMH